MRTSVTCKPRRLPILALAGLLTFWSASAVPQRASTHPAASVQDDDDEGPVCKKCRSEGREPCPEHEKHECALEESVLFCSEVADCATCGGTGYVDCPFCDNDSVQSGLEKRRADIVRRGEKNAWLEKELGKKVRYAESEHFIVIWEMKDMKVDKVRKSPHEMLHLTIERMERLFDLYLEKLGAREGDFAEKALVAIWWWPMDQEDASARLCGSTSSVGVKLYGGKPRYSTCGAKQNFKDDEALHQSLVHNVAHLLLSHQRPSYWIGNDRKGWADAGVAHWFEYELSGTCRNYCYEEQNTKRDFKGGKFKVGVRKLVALGKQASMSSVMQKQTTELTPDEHALAFSYVDYLMQKDGKALNKLLIQLRERRETRDALQDTFGISILEFEELWKAWVLETYPTR
ncbi:MAG: hypothetical protein H6831_03650 [Planctomycetes bacterium]|nr:hypothetical protein [Planctomycetota bacterium]MCB9903480.1 hypothetical protein [Planctomycetota bacterium]